MERDVEGESWVLPVEDPRCECEMRGAADGQEFAEPLDDAKDEGLKNSHDIRWREEQERANARDIKLTLTASSARREGEIVKGLVLLHDVVDREPLPGIACGELAHRPQPILVA